MRDTVIILFFFIYQESVGLRLLTSESDSPCGTCKQSMPADERLLILGNVVAGHGSTALLSFMSGSPNVANLCSADSWQCEGFTIDKEHCEGVIDPKPCSNADSLLHTIGKYWNLSKPVFYDKLFPDEQGYSNKFLRDTVDPIRFEFQAGPREEQCALRVPPEMKKAGIKKIRLSFIFMYHPQCIKSEYPRAHAITQLVEQHKLLTEHGHDVTVINYADLIWNTDKLSQQLQKKFPCLDHFDTEFVLKAKHANHAPTTVKEYGQQHKPATFGYNLGTHTCNDPGQHSDISEAVEYLQKFSVQIPQK